MKSRQTNSTLKSKSLFSHLFSVPFRARMTFLHHNGVEKLILNGNTYIMYQKCSQQILHAIYRPETVKTVRADTLISSRLGLIKRMFVKFCCKYTCPKVLLSSPGGHNRTFGNLLLVGSGLNLNILSGARPVLAKFIPSSRIPGRVPKESGVSLFFFF